MLARKCGPGKTVCHSLDWPSEQAQPKTLEVRGRECREAHGSVDSGSVAVRKPSAYTYAPARREIATIARVNVAFPALAEPFCDPVADAEGPAEFASPCHLRAGARRGEPG